MRERILLVATELIRRHGPTGATARLICDAAGIKAPTLYHYFGDMDGLREAVVERAFGRILETSSSGWRSGEGIVGLKQSWDVYLSFAADEPALFAILANRIVSGPMPKTVFDTLAQFEAALSAPMFEGRLRYPAARSAHILWAAAQGAGSLLLAGQAGVPISPDLGQDMFETVMAALLPS